MSKTIRVGGTRDGKAYLANNRRRWHNTEAKPARKVTNRSVRRTERDVLHRMGDYYTGVLPGRPATSGWITH